MITGIIHKGSGLGDQLFSYIATRVRAADLGVPFGFVGKEYFKGKDFMDLDWGEDANILFNVEYPAGKVVIDNLSGNGSYKTYTLNSPSFDPEFDFIPDGSVIDGYGAQDSRYYENHLHLIADWMKVKPLGVDNGLCIINFRGGEYKTVPDLYLPYEYWDEAKKTMFGLGVSNYQIHTDDPSSASEMLLDRPSDLPIRDIGLNWRSLRYARHAIISNSAFAIIPRLLKHYEDENAVTIAPRFWAGRNRGEKWERPGNYYRQFTYI